MTPFGKILWQGVIPIFLLVVGSVVLYHEFYPVARDPTVPPVVSAVEVGRQFERARATIGADAWEAWAKSIEQGRTVGESTKALQTGQHEGFAKSFVSIVAPAMGKIVGEGKEPTEPAQREALVKFGLDMATGQRKAVGR